MAKTERQNNRAVIYCRKSLCRDSDISQSCDTQEEICRKFADFHSLEVIAVYRDNSISGANAANRPGLQDAIHLAVKKQSLLMVYSLSRLARNTKETIEIVDRLNHAKADLCSVSEKIDTSTPMGRMFYKIIAILAEMEREIISERTSDAMIRHQLNGRRMSFLPPYGWKIDPEDPKHLLKNLYEQNAITLILDWRKEGLTLMKIADSLRERNIKPRQVREKTADGKIVFRNGVWRHDMVNRIIKRQVDLNRT